MNCRYTKLPGVFVLEPDLFADPRGVFTPLFVREDMPDVIGPRQIVRVNHSTNREEGTLRGFHLQLAPFEETKIVQCMRGRIYDVALDLRVGSATFGQWFAEELDAESRRMLVIPEGFGHAFQTMEPDTDIMYFVTGDYAPDREINVNATDATLQVPWPRPLTVRSDKDTHSYDLAGHAAHGFHGVELSSPWQAELEEQMKQRTDAATLNQMHARDHFLGDLLAACRAETQADAGSVYLVQDDEAQGKTLRFLHMQNDSRDLDYSERSLPCNEQSIAGYVASTGNPVRVEDAYQGSAEAPFQLDPSFDQENGYVTRSVLAVPLTDPTGQIRAVLQLINRKRSMDARLTDADAVSRQVVPFEGSHLEQVQSRVGQASTKYFPDAE